MHQPQWLSIGFNAMMANYLISWRKIKPHINTQQLFPILVETSIENNNS